MLAGESSWGYKSPPPHQKTSLVFYRKMELLVAARRLAFPAPLCAHGSNESPIVTAASLLNVCQPAEAPLTDSANAGGGRGIRTPERVSPLTVFKTAGFNHSPIPPFTILTEFIRLLRLEQEMTTAYPISKRSISLLPFNMLATWREIYLGSGRT